MPADAVRPAAVTEVVATGPAAAPGVGAARAVEASPSPAPAGDDQAALQLGISALQSFQSVTQQCDGKANMLLAVQVGLGALVGTQLTELTGIPRGGALAVAFWALSVGCLVAFVVAGVLVLQVIVPRRVGLTPGNPLALPGPATPPGDGAAGLDAAGLDAAGLDAAGLDAAGLGTAECSRHVWEMARGVAVLAARKNAFFTRAVTATVVMVGCTMAWLVVVALGGW